jgi:nicotinamidase-related amidase
MKLIVIDIQKALIDEDLYDMRGFLDRICRIIEAARENGAEVIFVKHDAGPGTGFSDGDEGFEFTEEISPLDREKVFVKTINSCFGNRDFTAYLSDSGDSDLMIVGLQTDFCIDATVKSAFERGYRVIIPQGTNSTFDNMYMTAGVSCAYYFNEIWPMFAECVSFDEAVSVLKSGRTD